MDAEKIKRAEEIFQIAIDLPVEERERVLRERCADDGGLRAFVERLLSHDAVGLGEFMCNPVFTPALDEATAAQAALPERIGHYEIIRVVGEGGMGVVYEARQENPSRTVALKVLRSGLPSGHMLRRFQHEAEVLGQLQHPGIAHIYEAATAEVGTDGSVAVKLPYFAMEYIRGRSLTEHAKHHNLGTRQRLELAASICDAVQHAHQKGVIHRDLKPGNILVDETGQPRILDFGVARATDADVQTMTMQTSVGQLIGTVPYMSPEQVTGDSRQLDTRSDVYALGVILYELLSGSVPHDVRSLSIPEAARKIRDEQPARLASINRVLRGEIDTIVAKALEKDKTRRYQSASDLAGDIRRYLRGAAIEAKSDSALYVLGKTVVRYRGFVLAAALVVVLLAAFGVVSLIQAEKNRRLARDESAARARADATAAQLAAELTARNIEHGRLLGRTGNLIAAEELIWREHLQNPESNHSFWALWDLYSHNPSLAILGMHDRALRATEYAPDGRLLASAGDDAVVKLWDTVTLQCVATLRGHAAAVWGLDFDPEQQHLVSASLDGMVIVWDLSTNEPARTLRGHEGGVYSVCYSPDGAQLICGAEDGTIHIVDAVTGDAIRTLSEHKAAVRCLRFSRDGSLLASSSDDRTIRLWRDLTGPPVATLSGHRGTIGSLTFSPDDRMLASGSGDKTARVWDLTTYECAETIRATCRNVRFVRFSRDGQSLIVGGGLHVDAWDLNTRTHRGLQPHGIHVADTSPDGRFLACGAGHTRLWPRSTVRVTDIDRDAGLLKLGGTTGGGPATVSPDSRLIAASDAAGHVRLWETATGRLLATLEGHPNRWSSCHFHPSGKLLATCTSGEIKLWDLATGTLVSTLRGHHAPSTHSLSFSPDGATMVASWRGGTIEIRAVPSGEIVTTIPAAGSEVLSVRFSPDGRTIAATYRSGVIRLYSAPGELLAELDTGDPTPWTAAFSPDGKKLAVACWGCYVQLWDLTARALELQLEASKAVIWEVAYLPGDSNILASCSADGYVKLWDLRERCNVLTFDPFDGSAVSVSFSPDGKTLVAAGGDDGRLLAWDLEYYERHMAGHVRFHMDLLGPELGDAIQSEYLNEWADEVLRRPWPRIGPQAQQHAHLPEDATALRGVDPDVIAAWGSAPRR